MHTSLALKLDIQACLAQSDTEVPPRQRPLADQEQPPSGGERPAWCRRSTLIRRSSSRIPAWSSCPTTGLCQVPAGPPGGVNGGDGPGGGDVLRIETPRLMMNARLKNDDDRWVTPESLSASTSGQSHCLSWIYRLTYMLRKPVESSRYGRSVLRMLRLRS